MQQKRENLKAKEEKNKEKKTTTNEKKNKIMKVYFEIFLVIIKNKSIFHSYNNICTLWVYIYI